MFTQSLWNDFADVFEHPTLEGDLEVDVAVIGGGITGITAAHLLAEKGFKVAVLESRKVGGGTTSHSTGNLYFTIDQILTQLRKKYDVETVQAVIASRASALDKMESLVRQFRLDCDFHRRPWYLYAAESAQVSKIDRELEVAREAGVAMESAASDTFSLPVVKGVKVENQAQLNPMRYVQGLAKNIAAPSCLIYENTRVTELEEQGARVLLRTERGRIQADYAIHATHTPKGVKTVQTLLGPYREYGIACRAGQLDFPEGIFWGYHEGGAKFSTRLYERAGQRFLIVVGQPHKVGQAEDNRAHIQKLEAFAEKHFGALPVVYRWGGQHYRPADLLPYIGREDAERNIFIATGFSTDGLVYGTLSAMLICDTLIGAENNWNRLYDYRRLHPLKSAKKFLKENLNVAGQYLKDWVAKGQSETLDDLAKEEGRIISRNGKPIAAYRDRTGNISLVSAVCSHLKCIVHWNNAEKTWDCPCHGTRFKPDGSVLEGPAFGPLEREERS